jgi:hypothetical protein
LDYWNLACIQNAIASFGRVVLWENDQGFLTRLLVRARVTKMEGIPHFIVRSENEGFQGQSWALGYEALEQQFLGVLPADEDPVLVMEVDGNPPPFDFFSDLDNQDPHLFNPRTKVWMRILWKMKLIGRLNSKMLNR